MNAQPWLAVSEGQALRFFFEHLRDVSDEPDAPEAELLYNASVLAHFATTSAATVDFPRAPTSLTTVFDLFVLDQSEQIDPDILEAAASQCLLLTGFFGAQLRSRHNLAWYARLGAGFFERAAILAAAGAGRQGGGATSGPRHGDAATSGLSHGDAATSGLRHGDAAMSGPRHGEGAMSGPRHGEGAMSARAAMMHRMAMRFAYWRRQQARLAKELHDLPKLVGRVH